MRLFSIYIFIVFGIVVSCVKNNNSKHIVFNSPESLTAVDSINIMELGIIDPDAIICSGDSIWITDNEGKGENLVFLLDKEGSLIAKGVNIGNGRGEVLEITSMHISQNNPYIYDGRRGILSVVHRSDSALFLSPDLSDINMLDDAIRMAGDTVLTIPVLEQYDYALFDNNGTKLDTLVYSPAKPDGVDDFTHKLACTGETAVLSKDGCFARSLVYDGAIDFFNIADNRLKHISRHEDFPMEYDVIDMGEKVPTVAKNTRVGYSSLTSSGDYFFSLFSDTIPLTDQSKGCSEIRVFNSTGQPLKAYSSDRHLTEICVNPDNSVIYALGPTEDGGKKLYIYKIKL